MIGCSRFTSSESLLLRREARANLRPSAATILSPMWRSPTRRGRVSDVTLKRNETSAIFPADPPLEHRIFSRPLKTEDFVIRKSGCGLKTRESIRRRVYLRCRPDRCRDTGYSRCLLHHTTIVDTCDKCNLIISDGFERAASLRSHFLATRMCGMILNSFAFNFFFFFLIALKERVA